jgi:hypothetical protein
LAAAPEDPEMLPWHSARAASIISTSRSGYRAAQIAEVATVPVRIKNMTDAEVLEVQLIELSIVVKGLLCVHAGLHIVSM